MGTKEERYDRQLRIWGDWGQVQLNRSNVAVVGTSTVAVEASRAFVLSGLGTLTIVGETGKDVDWVRSLNDDVTVTVLPSLSQLLNTDVSLVLFADVPLWGLRAAAEAAKPWEQRGCPVIFAGIAGFAGFVKVQCQDIWSVTDACMEQQNVLPPARFFMNLFHPPAGVVAAVNELNFSQPKIHEIPWPLLICKTLQLLGDDTNSLPQKVRHLLKEKLPPGLENAAEAVIGCSALVLSEEGEEILRVAQNADPFVAGALVLGDRRCATILALKGGILLREKLKRLPYHGVVPDMIGSSKAFLAYKKLMSDAAAEDAKMILNLVDDVYGEGTAASCDLDEQHIKRVFSLLHRGCFIVNRSSLREELQAENLTADALAEFVEDSNNQIGGAAGPGSPFTIYFLMRTLDRFVVEEPNCTSNLSAVLSTPEGVQRLRNCYIRTAAGLCPDGPIPDFKTVEQAAKCAAVGFALHPTAAMIGATAAQESLKILTSHGLPGNWFIVDGFLPRGFSGGFFSRA